MFINTDIAETVWRRREQLQVNIPAGTPVISFEMDPTGHFYVTVQVDINGTPHNEEFSVRPHLLTHETDEELATLAEATRRNQRQEAWGNDQTHRTLYSGLGLAFLACDADLSAGEFFVYSTTHGTVLTNGIVQAQSEEAAREKVGQLFPADVSVTLTPIPEQVLACMVVGGAHQFYSRRQAVRGRK